MTRFGSTLHSRFTLRTRLTLVYGVLFFLAGTAVLGVTYALVSQQLTKEVNRQDTPTSNVNTPTNGSIKPVPTGSITNQDKPEFNSRNVAGNTRDEALQAILTRGGIALGLVGICAIGFGWFIAGRILRPVKTITDTAQRIADSADGQRHIEERIALQGPPDEVKTLADTFDGMLERLDRSFDSQRHFIASASHELRTPLAVNRALIEVAIHRDNAPDELKQLGETLLEVNARHAHLIDGLFLLARSERTLIEKSFVDIADIIDHAIERLPTSSVAIESHTSEAPTQGDPLLLERLVQNLVENAVRYNIPKQGWVKLSSGNNNDGTVWFEVTNTGPEVASSDIPALFEPFRQLGKERLASSEGLGLGLSIVRAITAAHHGNVHIQPCPGGGGLTVRVTLPGEI